MKTQRRIITAGLAVVAFWVVIDFMLPVEAFVVRQNDRVFLVDRTGERWDITQAVSIGFNPEKFEFGIGRHAFQPLSDEDWQTGGDAGSQKIRIIGISRNGSAHAYAVSRLAHHETANTTLAGKPVVAGYWPLVDLAAVYSREIDGKPLTLAPSGWTYERTFVLYDKETGTLWFPERDSLQGIQGVYFGRRLPELPSADTTYGNWREKHPSTKLMK